MIINHMKIFPQYDKLPMKPITLYSNSFVIPTRTCAWTLVHILICTAIIIGTIILGYTGVIRK